MSIGRFQIYLGVILDRAIFLRKSRETLCSGDVLTKLVARSFLLLMQSAFKTSRTDTVAFSPFPRLAQAFVGG